MMRTATSRSTGDKSKGGRPALDPEDPSARVGLTLPGKQFDKYAKQALREDVSVPAIIRRELRKAAGKKSTNR